MEESDFSYVMIASEAKSGNIGATNICEVVDVLYI